MKLLSASILSGILLAGRAGASAPVDELVVRLADEKFSVREEATRELWIMGKPALLKLREAAESNDPERAFRAADLVRKIDFSITPDTSPEILKLVERYQRSDAKDKPRLLREMYRNRAWYQMLKLYSEEPPAVRSVLKQRMEGVSLMAARDFLAAGNIAGAKEILEMAAVDSNGLMALAAFHRSQGTLQAEIRRVTGQTRQADSASTAAWMLALRRAEGNVKAARIAAEAANDNQLMALMAALEGDPLPWLKQVPHKNLAEARYLELAIKRWNGGAVRSSELEPLTRQAGSQDHILRTSAVNALWLLGEKKAAEDLFTKTQHLGAFSYFESTERIPEALTALGLDPLNPDYSSWVAERAGKLIQNENEENDQPQASQELLIMGNFLELRGLRDEWKSAFLPALEKVGSIDPAALNIFLQALFSRENRRIICPDIGAAAGMAWAGNDQGRWRELFSYATAGQADMSVWWDWLGEIEPTATNEEKLNAVLVILESTPDSVGVRGPWIERIWRFIDAQPQDKQSAYLQRLVITFLQAPDVKNCIKAWDRLPEATRLQILDSPQGSTLSLYFSATERWNDAAEYFLRRISQQKSQPLFYAFAASNLRKAGREDEARSMDAWVEKLALGDASSASQISEAYAYGLDFKRAELWLGRSVIEADTENPLLQTLLEKYGDSLAEQEHWAEAAAVKEVVARTLCSNNNQNLTPMALVRLRMEADMYRAMARLKIDREGSLATLEQCQRILIGDGSLADIFFPALRKAGLIKQHDAWFESTWVIATQACRQFPNCDNLHNNAAWLASRACRRLDEAESHSGISLRLHPFNAAALDTMAEVQFAKGQREKAVEWSTQSVNYMPADKTIRQQHERFRNAPFPK